MRKKFQKGICNNPTDQFHISGFTIESLPRCSLAMLKGNDNLYEKIKNIGLKEVFIVSSCNRIQFFYFSRTDRSHELLSILSADEEIRNRSTNLSGLSAVRYMMESAFGLNSYVTGDSGIFKQIRRSLDQAAENKTSGMYTERIKEKMLNLSEQDFLQAFTAPSESNQVVKLIELKELSSPTSIMIIGTGAVAENAIRELRQSSDKNIANANIYVASKDAERLDNFSRKHNVNSEKIIYSSHGEGINLPEGIDIIIKCRETNILKNIKPEKHLEIYELSTPAENQVAIHANITLYELPYIQDKLRQRPEVKYLEERKIAVSTMIGKFVRDNFYPENASIITKLSSSMFSEEPCGIFNNIRVSGGTIYLPGR